MPDRIAPRPVPEPEVITLLRRPKSGFVVYPKFIPKRMVDGRARYMTKCDMLVGPCACGYTHTEDDGWVRDTLAEHYLRIEPLILWGEQQQRGDVVEIPGYWKQSRRWNRQGCDVLVGPCICGRTHSIRETWVQNALRRYNAVILNLPEVDNVDEEPSIDDYPSRYYTPEVRETRMNRINSISFEGQNAPSSIYQEACALNEEAKQQNQIVSNEDFESIQHLLLPRERQDRVDRITASSDPAWHILLEERKQRELLEWASISQYIRDHCSDHSQHVWSVFFSNEQGQAPFFCNCHACCQARLRRRNQEANPPASRSAISRNYQELDRRFREEAFFPWLDNSDNEQWFATEDDG